MWLWLVIAIPFLFLIGMIYNAIKEQHRLEQGPLKKILSERAREKQRLLEEAKKSGRPLTDVSGRGRSRGGYDDEDD